MINVNMNDMMYNFNGINNMMMLNNNMNQNDKEQILNLINQNIQMTNQIAINNNLIKNMIENSNFGNDNQQNNKIDEEMGKIDFFPGKKGKKINVIFEWDPTDRINIITPLDITMKELLEGFYIKYQIKAIIDNKKIYNLDDFIFIHDTRMISSFDENKTLSQIGLKHLHERIIYKFKNVLIGGNI